MATARWEFSYDTLTTRRGALAKRIADYGIAQMNLRKRGEPYGDYPALIAQCQSVLYALNTYDYAYYNPTDSPNYLTIDECAELIQLSWRLAPDVGFAYTPGQYVSQSYVPGGGGGGGSSLNLMRLSFDPIANPYVNANLIGLNQVDIKVWNAGVDLMTDPSTTFDSATGTITFAFQPTGLTHLWAVIA